MSKSHSLILILDYGSQYTQLITRRCREIGYYSLIKHGGLSLAEIQKLNPAAIVLSGGPNSVYDQGAPQFPTGFLEFVEERKIPLLGICYGMQLMVHTLGGKVEKADLREYGRMPIQSCAESELFEDGSQSCEVWMSHGDEAQELPQGFTITAKSGSGSIAAIENPSRKMYGLQFHPEVTHTQNGIQLLKRFFGEIAGLKPDWNMSAVLDEQVEKIRAQVGPDQHVICALSGGVDSAVVAALVYKAIGDRLHCFFVDHGLLRYKEQERVMKLFKDQLHLPVTCLDHSERFLSKLKGVTDPEKKRKIIGAEFIASFEIAAEELSKQSGSVPAFLVQGTLYPDVIESSPGHGHSVTIKSHHNVGGLPENLRFKLIEPLRDLFKDEVRKLGKELKVPEDFLKRHPFPGPGLAIRVMGEITPERLNILREVDEIFISSIRAAGIYDQIWQAFAVFLPIQSVGVQGDGRTHDYVVSLRAVNSSDGMTADWFTFDHRFLGEVSSKICNQVRGVNRVVYDITSKPPGTIEWE